MADYRRHDAPDQDRPREVLSPWARAATLSLTVLPFAGFALRGIFGAITALAGIGIAVSSAPRWTRNNVIERSESKWILRRLEKFHRKEQHLSEREREAKEEYENPEKWEVVVINAGWIVTVVCVPLAVVFAVLAILTDIPGAIAEALAIAAAVGLGPFFFARIIPLFALQAMADQSRGGIKTVTLRDLAMKVEAWPHKMPLFLISSVAAIVATLFMI